MLSNRLPEAMVAFTNGSLLKKSRNAILSSLRWRRTMWPFRKKTDKQEPMKPETPGKFIFNVEATKRMLEKKADEAQKETTPDDPKPITPGEKLECPSCKQLIDKYSKRSKCPLCKNWVYYFNGRLYSQEESQCIKSEFYNRRFHNREAAKTSSDLGISDEIIREREKELTTKFGKTPSRASVFMSLFNEAILKVKDLREQERQYMEAARVLDRMGEDSFHLQKAAALARLAALRREKYSSVYILATGNCDSCKALDSKVMTIDEAKEKMPIPIREGCTNRGEGDKYSICVCSYEGEADNEYIKNTFDV